MTVGDLGQTCSLHLTNNAMVLTYITTFLFIMTDNGEIPCEASLRNVDFSKPDVLVAGDIDGPFRR